MPKTPFHTLIWSQDHAHYELSTQGQRERNFSPEDTDAWLSWLTTATSFTFRGVAGRLNVYQEARGETSHYWYAYHTTGKRTRKRYLGLPATVTFARLEAVASALDQGESAQNTPSPDAMLDRPLLSTSLVHPQLRSTLVVRERLLTQLDAACSHRLTLLAASAGWGKTTLLSMWAARSRFPVAWLSLSELDNEPNRFWISVLAALRTCLPGVGKTSLAMLRSPQPQPLTASLLALLQEFEGLTQPLVLIVDDYHLMEDPAIHDSLLFLLERLPMHFHLVLASRVDPELPLARFRVRGQLLELRDANLRFQDDEATCFFVQVMNLSLSAEEVTLLLQRTEGWPAGLQLAALSMHKHEDLSAFVQSFAGSHRHVLDYVQEEIVARLPATLQRFLPQIAILNKISAPVCQAITGEAESWTWLAQIERANLFLVPLDEERHWYRMHDLFREALLAHLRTTQPETVALLHQRAARFYEEQEAFREAIFHALSAEDFGLAARLMEQTLEESCLAGESQSFFPWVMTLPLAVIRQHAHFALTATLYLLNLASSTGATHQAHLQTQGGLMMGRIEKALLQYHVTQETQEEQFPAAELALFQQRLRLLRLWNEVITGNGSNSLERYRRAVEQMQQLKLEDSITWQVLSLTITFVWHWTFQGKGTSLIPLYQDAWERARQAGDHFALLKVQQWLAGVYVTAGKLHLAYHLCQTGLTLITQVCGYTLLSGYFSNWLARVLYEWNRLDEARTVVQKLIHDAQRWQHLDLQIHGHIRWLEIEFAVGDLVGARQVMQQLMALIPKTGLDRHLLPLVQATCWLETGELAQAAGWTTQMAWQQETMIFVFALRYKLLLLVRIFLACQQYRVALDILEQHHQQLDQPEDLATCTAFLALSVVALQQLGEREEAQTTLARLLTLTEPEGYLRVYLNQGLPMQEALRDFLRTPTASGDHGSATSRAYASYLLAAFDQEKEKCILKASVPSDTPQAMETFPGKTSSSPAFLESLTAQEQRVLRLLAAGRSTQEIAQVLVVSPNTVKTHLRNLYGKLQANSRTQALALAREFQLL